jgi:N-acetylneuraminic acid mutarotase
MRMNTYQKYLLLSAGALLLSGCASHESKSSAAKIVSATTLAPMPEAVTSFAAVTHEDWVYVCGGHRGERHEYSADMVSGAFHRLRLSDGTRWEPLASTLPAQGTPLVARGRYLYRTGGMAARNAKGTKQDLYSLAQVLRYDTRNERWEEITPLPEPRSSHDAVILGETLYVGGGWQLKGGTNKPVWPDSLLALDLREPKAQWKKIAQPFQRRALAMAVLGDRIYFIGGMNADNSTTLAVDDYDTRTGKWSKGPDLPPGKNKGFACSAIAQAGRIYANTFQGDLLRLSSDASAWEVTGRLQHPRIAHRLVTAGTTQLVALGGEDGEAKRPELELLTPTQAPRAAQKQSQHHSQIQPSTSAQ